MNILSNALPFTAALSLGLSSVGTSFAKSDGGDLLTPHLDLRLRYETADQDNDKQTAEAFTLRHRIGLSAQPAQSLKLYLESEGVISLNDENYNSGPGGNGHSEYSVIADPSDNELNQAYVDWSHKALNVRVGRQRIIYDNARFIGNVGWRQNEQTFDAAALKLTPTQSLSLNYAYVSNVNRIFFDNQDLDGHLANAALKLHADHTLTAYGYLLDYQRAADSQTLGLRLTGKTQLAGGDLSYQLEFAQQSDYADASPNYELDYSQIELSYANNGVIAAIGRESLGSDGSQAFSTPLATLHKFNGWADVFLNTPSNGLQDSYIKLGYTQKPWKALAFYHQFDADNGDADYGRELDVLLAYRLCAAAGLTLKYAHYEAETFAVDTERFSAQIDIKL